jgi:hypothetical protein
MKRFSITMNKLIIPDLCDENATQLHEEKSVIKLVYTAHTCHGFVTLYTRV